MAKYGPHFMSAAVAYEVQRTNNFRLVIDLSAYGEVDSVIELACDSVSLPTVSNDPIELAYGNSKVKVAGQAGTDDVTVSVKDFIQADVEAILWKWRMAVYDPNTELLGWAENYKRNGYIYQYGPDGTYVRGWAIEGVWPVSLDLGELNYDGGDKKSISMTLSCDRAYRLGRDTGRNSAPTDTLKGVTSTSDESMVVTGNNRTGGF